MFITNVAAQVSFMIYHYSPAQAIFFLSKMNFPHYCKQYQGTSALEMGNIHIILRKKANY